MDVGKVASPNGGPMHPKSARRLLKFLRGALVSDRA